MRRWRLAGVLAALLAASPSLAAPPRRDELPVLINAVLSGPSVAADRAAERLRYFGPDVAGPPLRALLLSMDPHARIAASSALIIVRDPGAGPALLHALKDEDWEVRRNAVTALSVIGSKAYVKPIEQSLRTDAKVHVRKACVKALESLKGGAGGLADASAKDTVLEVRLAALDVLARQKDHSVRGKLRPLLNDNSEFIRFAAARTLVWQDDAVAEKFIVKATTSKSTDEARQAMTAISDVPSPWAHAQLESGLQHADRAVALAAALGLAKQHLESGLRYLARLERQQVPEAETARSTLDSLGISAADRAHLVAESM